MSSVFAVIFIIISIVLKIVAENNKKTQQQTPPIQPSGDMERRLEELRRMINESQKNNSQEYDEEYDNEESPDYYDNDEEEEYTPQYEPIPSAQEIIEPISIPKPAESIVKSSDMTPTPLAYNLPNEGISAFTHQEESPNSSQQIPPAQQPEAALSIDDMRRAIIYQTILERPKF
ncbi:MAG: hypothetical protein Q4C30_03560 [Bacteroidia bacterium]|nr:hypothetical protein [Bacteroidia bacterium]